MSATSSLLIELGTEELPVKALPGLADAFLTGIRGGLEKRGIGFDADSARVLYTPRRIAVIGHSRTGKTALWAAAQDERFALACVNGAGEGGPALARRHFGETLGQITRSFPHWFTSRYASYAERIGELPRKGNITLLLDAAPHRDDALCL